jgi:hypothetical protein
MTPLPFMQALCNIFNYYVETVEHNLNSENKDSFDLLLSYNGVEALYTCIHNANKDELVPSDDRRTIDLTIKKDKPATSHGQNFGGVLTKSRYRNL